MRAIPRPRTRRLRPHADALPQRSQQVQRIINLSSAATRVALPELVYAMTKGAINALCRSLAQEVGTRGITVNAVAPGPTVTESSGWMVATPELEARLGAANALNRVGLPADIASTIAFLASDDAAGLPAVWWT